MSKLTDFITLHAESGTKKRAQAIAGPFGNVSKVLRQALKIGLDALEKEYGQQKREK